MDAEPLGAELWRSRQDEFLQAAVAVWNPPSVLNVLCHLEWARRRPGFAIDFVSCAQEQRRGWFERIDHWRDCADFDILRLLNLWYGYAQELPADLVAEVEERLVGFKYWFTDPTPDGVTDHRWYWSENHRLIFHTSELLAGQAFPEAPFGSDGRSGAVHMERARRYLDAWFDEKARYGFSEWHSDVYYEKDLAPLLALVEWADETAVAERAACFLDLLLFDVSLHVHRGNLGSTHGRSYMKDKSRARDQPMFGAVKMCFGGSADPWPVDSGDAADLTPLDEGATLLACARRYRPPAILGRIAAYGEPVIDREGMGVEIDPSEPLVDEPVREDGLSYSNPDMVAFWWDRSALTSWQVVPLTLDTMDTHGLWDADLFAPFRAVRDLTGGDREVARQLAHAFAPMVNAGLLTRVDTLTYRTRHVMLSTAQSYRPGCAGYQQHVGQATLDEDAVVFTTHPGNEPWEDPNAYRDMDHYWTGSATLPRSVQHGCVAIHMYSPGFAVPDVPGIASFGFLDYTHAYFPTERFDAVERSGNWTFGCRAGGYVALWSWRAPVWREHDPSIVCTNDLVEPFDLVAPGGPDNVWIVEVGDVDQWGSFAGFVDAVGSAAVTVRSLGSDAGIHRGFEVAYDSAIEGELEVSWDGPLRVGGREVVIQGYPRFDNPWARVERGETTVRIVDESGSLVLDLARGKRFDDEDG